MTRDLGLYAVHILEAIANIEAEIAHHDLASFQEDRRTRQLVERNLEILSEASRRLPEEAKAREPGVPWKRVAGLGNVLRHDYHQTDPEILWQTCQEDLEALKAAVERIRDATKG